MKFVFLLPIAIFIPGLATATAQEYSILNTCGDSASHCLPQQLHSFDEPSPWLHGQHRRVPSYGGFATFRPHNFRHVLPQSQLAERAGMPRGLGYSQQFFDRNKIYDANTNPPPQLNRVPVAPPSQPAPRQFEPRFYISAAPITLAPLSRPERSLQPTKAQPGTSPQQPSVYVYPPGIQLKDEPRSSP